MDSRLRRFPPDRVSAVPYGQTVDNAMRCPPLAHRSAAAHKLHSAQANRYKIRESQNQNPGTGLSLFQPGGCPNDRDHRNLPSEGPVGEVRAELLGDSGNVADRVHQAIIAFQFYDKLVQRLSHVTHSLGELSDLVGQPVRLYNPEEWVGLQQRIKAKYSTREESAMFEAVMAGVPVHEAVARFNQEMREQEDDIEFF